MIITRKFKENRWISKNDDERLKRIETFENNRKQLEIRECGNEGI